MNPQQDHQAQFNALYTAASEHGDAAAGLALCSMLTRMRVKQAHPAIGRAWEAALAAPWDRPDRLAQPALAYLALHPEVERALAQPDDAAALAPAIARLSGLRLFQLLASLALITPLAWQDLLLRWRALALERWHAGHGIGPGLAWVAVQAHLGNHVWPLGTEPQAQAALAALRTRVAGESALPDEVVLLACFEHPGAPGQYALGESDPAQRLLLQRLYREPLQEGVIAGSLESRAAQALPRGAQRGQYELYPYPSWVAEPLLPAAIPPQAQARRKHRWWRREQVLLAGCGTGLQCMSARATYAEAAITAIDFSATSLSYAVRKCREAGVRDISFEAADLLAYARRGRQFDLVECLGVLHHLTQLDAGAAALAALVRRDGLLRLAVYSAAARQPVRELRAMIAARGLDGSLDSLRRVRAELLAGVHGAVSPSILESPDLHSASGLHDLLFNACEHSLGAEAWCALMERHRFGLLCLDPPAATVAAAGPESRAWGPAEWEAFERDNPFAFGSMYEFWFVRRSGSP